MASSRASTSSSANAYSQLLRKSKMASYSPAVDQVYSSHSAFRARGDYGLKRSILPNKAAVSPFVRINEMDRDGRRVKYRQATKEVKYTKKWEELVSAPLHTSETASVIEDDGSAIRSRFVDRPEQFDDRGRLQPDLSLQARRPPNMLSVTETEFERLLDDLGERRVEFEEFVKEKMFPDSYAAEEEFELRGRLFGAAQPPPQERQHFDLQLLRTVEQFFNRTYTTTEVPVSPHPSLGLRYSTTTPLEAALEPPVPGRLLGPNKSGHAPSHLVSVIGQIASLSKAPSNVAATRFMPDAEGLRNNHAGRSSWRVEARVNENYWATAKADEVAALNRPLPHEPELLALQPVSMQVRHAPEEARPPVIGSGEYVGREPDHPVDARTSHRLSDTHKFEYGLISSNYRAGGGRNAGPAGAAGWEARKERQKREQELVEARRNDPNYQPRPGRTGESREALHSALRDLLNKSSSGGTKK